MQDETNSLLSDLSGGDWGANSLGVYLPHMQENNVIVGTRIDFANGKLMVIMEERPISVPDVGTNGKAYLRQTAQRVYAFISLEDYLNNVPGFTECTLLPSAV